ncbi:MAG: Fe-S-containing hydro-lyase [Pseudomonadota bacterium]
MDEAEHTKGRVIRLTTPLTDADVEQLRAGDSVRISGTIYTGRDAAHRRLFEVLQRGEESPIPLQGQIIYYVGPTPAPPGRPIGSAGPTTSYRMDPFAPLLMERGLKAMIGKGMRAAEVKEAMRRYKAVYFTATGGAGALISGAIKQAEVVLYEDLGPEAVRRLVVEDFPVLVVNDIHGGDLYLEGRRRYAREVTA